jgi:hypothetical protein
MALHSEYHMKFAKWVESKDLDKQKLREYLVTLILAVVFSAFLVLGFNFKHEIFGYSDPMLYLAYLLITILVFLLLLVFWKVCDRVSRFFLKHQKTPKAATGNFDKRSTFTLIWLLIFLCWIPIWLAAWPGFFCYDATGPLTSFMNGQIDPNQPLLHTVIMSGAILLGQGLTDSFNYGIALFIGISSLITSFVLAASLKVLYQQNAPKALLGVSLLYYCFSPIVSMFSLCSTKDVLFSVALVVVFLALFLAQQKPVLAHKWQNLIIFTLLIFVLLAFRNNTIIAIVISAPFLIYFCQGFRKQLSLALLSAFALFFIWTGLSQYIFPVDKELDQSALLVASVPTQQISRVWNEADLTADQRDEIADTLKSSQFDSINEYQELCADVSRNAFRDILVDKPDEPRFLELYMELGTKYPEIYFDGFLAMTYEAWYPFSTVDGYNGGWNIWHSYDSTETSLFSCDVEPPGEFNSKIPWLYDILWQISRFEVLQTNPFLAWIVSIPFCLWLLLLVFARSLIKNQRDILPSCIICLAIILTLLLGPMVLVRYYLFLFYILPLSVFQLVRPCVE